jgi:hypothetical protein
VRVHTRRSKTGGKEIRSDDADRNRWKDHVVVYCLLLIVFVADSSCWLLLVDEIGNCDHKMR